MYRKRISALESGRLYYGVRNYYRTATKGSMDYDPHTYKFFEEISDNVSPIATAMFEVNGYIKVCFLRVYYDSILFAIAHAGERGVVVEKPVYEIIGYPLEGMVRIESMSCVYNPVDKLLYVSVCIRSRLFDGNILLVVNPNDYATEDYKLKTLYTYYWHGTISSCLLINPRNNLVYLLDYFVIMGV